MQLDQLNHDCGDLHQAGVNVNQIVLCQTIVRAHGSAHAQQHRTICDVTKIPVLPAPRFQLSRTRLAAQCDFDTTAGRKGQVAGSEEFFSAMRGSLSCTCVILTVGKSQVALRLVHICRQHGSIFSLSPSALRWLNVIGRSVSV